MTQQLQQVIDAAWENRANISVKSAPKETVDAVGPGVAASAPQAAARNAIPYDVPGVRFSHRGERCSFDALLEDFAIHDGTLTGLSHIVRAADTGKPELTPQSAGLLAISLGLSTLHRDDHAMLEHSMSVYDALSAWQHAAAHEVHNADLFKAG